MHSSPCIVRGSCPLALWSEYLRGLPADPDFAARTSWPPVAGPNAHRPEYGGVGDPAYLRRLAARGERDES